MTPPREIPDWMRAEVQTEALIVRGVDTVGLVMSAADYNALVFLLGVAGASGPPFMEIALRLMRAFNPTPPEAAP